MTEPEEGPRFSDLGEIFDLDRTGLTKKLVTDMEQCLHDRMVANENLREVAAQAREAQFSARDVGAMKKLAKLRLDDKLGVAREELDALERISHALGLNLFGSAEES